MKDGVNSAIVIDCSAVTNFLLPEETISSVENVFSLFRKGKIQFLAPGLFVYEIANSLAMAVRHKKLNAAEHDIALRILCTIGIESNFHLRLNSQELAALDTLAAKHKLTIYDASYLFLALKTGAPLLTLDKALIKAAEAEKIIYRPKKAA